MEALYEFANQDKNRNIFNLDFNIKSTSSPGWIKTVGLRKEFYTYLTKDCVSLDSSACSCGKHVKYTVTRKYRKKIFLRV